MKKMKLIAAITAVVMALSMLSGAVNAQARVNTDQNAELMSMTEGDWEYSLSGTEAYLIKYNGSAQKVVVPSEIAGYSVTKLSKDAFADNTTVTDITVSKGIKIIEEAFDGCVNLKIVTIPESVTEISSYLFYGCTSLENVVLPETITKIGRYAFYKCKALKNINIPDSVTEIDDHAFQYCSSASGKVTIPDGIQKIGWGMFYGCESIDEIEIPASVTEIANDAFSACKSLNNINVSAGNTVYCSYNGDLFDKSKKTLIKYAVGKEQEEYRIPDGVESIEQKAFSDNDTLKKVDISDGVKSLELNTFYNCRALETVVIPKSVQEVYSAFVNCESLVNISVDKDNSSLFDIDGNLFMRGTAGISLIQYATGKSNTVYTVPYGVTSIDYLFDSCFVLEKIIIPETVTYIDEFAMEYCSPDFIIKGCSGTAAEEYANANSITFEPMTQQEKSVISITENNGVKKAVIKPEIGEGKEMPENVIAVFRNGADITGIDETPVSGGVYNVDIKGDAKSLKLFFWDSLAGMKPLAEPIIIGI